MTCRAQRGDGGERPLVLFGCGAASPIEPEQARIGRLVEGGIGTGDLANRVGRAGHIEDVVLDLKGKTNGGAVIL